MTTNPDDVVTRVEFDQRSASFVMGPSDVPSSTPDGSIATTRKRSVWRRFVRSKVALVALGFLFVLSLVAMFSNLLAPTDPMQLNVDGAAAFESPSGDHWLGTDHLGRDNASRLIVASRVALRDAAQVVAIALLVGVPLGLIAGFRGGWLDNVLMRLMDAILSVPPIIFILALAQMSHNELTWVLLGLSIAFVPSISRLVRGAALVVREEAFIEASIATGTPTRRILFRRLLPNVTSPIIVQGSIYLGTTIFLLAGLAILGIGYPVGSAAWGSMLSDAFENVSRSFWNMFYPGMAITLTVLAFNLVGDGLRDAFGLDRGSLYGARVSLGLTVAGRPGRRTEAAATEADATEATDATDGAATPARLLEVRELTVEIVGHGGRLRALDGVSVGVGHGEIVALVGESGAGKSVMSLAIMRLLPSPPFEITDGSIDFGGRDLTTLTFNEMREVRGREVAMIFQDPMMGLNPAYTVGRQIAEAVELHGDVGRRVAEQRAVEMLDRVRIPDPQRVARAYPHELSGGMRQRAMIAIALSCSPKLLIADEPTTALDVTVQAQVLELLRDLQADLDLSVIFITHDLGVVAELWDRAVVMYAGQVVEEAEVGRLFAAPTHPYTEGLLRAVPRMNTGNGENGDNGAAGGLTRAIPGQIPGLDALPSGCRFHPRCSYVTDECREHDIPLVGRDGSLSRCIRDISAAPVRVGRSS